MTFCQQLRSQNNVRVARVNLCQKSFNAPFFEVESRSKRITFFQEISASESIQASLFLNLMTLKHWIDMQCNWKSNGVPCRNDDNVADFYVDESPNLRRNERNVQPNRNRHKLALAQNRADSKTIKPALFSERCGYFF